MKSKDKTKQKKHESTIGKIIYGFLLFMPLLAIAITCAYVIFNKNAYQSVGYESVQETTQISYTGNLSNGLNYYISYNQSTDTNSMRINYSNVSVDWTDYNAPDRNYNAFAIQWYNNTETAIYLYVDNVWTHALYNVWGNTLKEFNFTCSENKTLNGNTNYNIYFINYNEYKLSDIFYYSIDKVEQSPLFSWAEDSTIYTGMNATCNALNITTTFIPLLLTYWLIISVIYFLYDIILIILHVFHRKIHELEESI